MLTETATPPPVEQPAPALPVAGFLEHIIANPMFHPGLYIAASPRGGRGVYSRRAFSAGDIIEDCPVIILPCEQEGLVHSTVLYDYTYAWGPGGEDLALCLGFGSIYNHSYRPCARYVRRPDARVMRYTALRDIRPGEEITVNYNCDPACDDPLWFHADPES